MTLDNPAPSNLPVFNFEVNLNWQRVVENTTVTAGVAATGYMVLKVLKKALNIATKPIMPIFVVPINTNFENYNTNEEL